MKINKILLFLIIYPIFLAAENLNNFEALNKDGKKEKIFRKEKYKFLILLNPKTCVAYYEEKDIWQKLCEDYKEWIECSLVVLGDKNDFEKINKILNLNIKIFYTAEKDIEKILKPVVFPMKYLINKEGKIIYFSYPNKDKTGKECLYREIENLLYHLEPDF